MEINVGCANLVKNVSRDFVYKEVIIINVLLCNQVGIYETVNYE